MGWARIQRLVTVVEDHQDEHQELAPEGSSGVAQKTQRDGVREVDGDHVPRHDQRDLRVPDEARPDDAVARLEARCAEQVPAPCERVRDQGNYHLFLGEQIRVVVGHLVGDRDRHE
jgi:hypothetical protein